MMPPRIFAEFVVVHAQFGFGLREALFHGPTHTTEPHQEAQGHTPWGVAEVVPIGGMLPEGAFNPTATLIRTCFSNTKSCGRIKNHFPLSLATANPRFSMCKFGQSIQVTL